MNVRVRLRGGLVIEGALYGAHPHRSTRPEVRNEAVCVYYILPHGLTPGHEVYLGCAMGARKAAFHPAIHVLGIEPIA